MAVDLFAGQVAPIAPVPTPASAPPVDLFAPSPAAYMMDTTNRYEQKANEATDPALKNALNATADAAANTLEKKPVDLFAEPKPSPVITSRPARGGAILAEPSQTDEPIKATGRFGAADYGEAIKNTAIGATQLPGTLLDMFKSVVSPNERGDAVWSALGEGVKAFSRDVQTKPVSTVAGAAGSAIGGEGVSEFFKTGDTSKMNAQTSLNLLMNAPVLKPLAYGAAASIGTAASTVLRKTPIGETLLKPADWLGKKVISKYNMTDEFLGLEQKFGGSKFAQTITETKPTAVRTGELFAQNPAAVPFIAPETNLSAENLRAINSGYTAHMNQIATTGPYGVPLTRAQIGKAPDFLFHNRGLNVIVDDQGFMRSGTADEFNRLPVDQQTKIMNVRAPIDANHQMMFDRGLIGEDEFRSGAMGYLHDTKRIFHNEADWMHEIKTNPGLQPMLATARTYIAKGLKNPLDPTLSATPAQIENQLYAVLRQAQELKNDPSIVASGPAGTAWTALIKKQAVPEPIANLLGKMDQEFTAVRVGQTLDMQNKMLLSDQFMTDMTGMTAHDGRPLMVRQPKGEKFAPVGQDYKILADNPIWTDKWKGAQVHPDVMDAIQTVGSPAMGGLIGKLGQAWKAMKVADNPSTHINNVFGDTLFTGYAGKSFYNPQNFSHFKDSLVDIAKFVSSDMTTASPQLLQEIRLGILRPGMASVEMGAGYAKLMNPGSIRTPEQFLERAMQHRGQAAISIAYDMEDQVFRSGTFRALVADGMTEQQATIEIAKYFPSYDVTSPVGNFLRGHASLGKVPASLGAFIGGPFTSFPIEAMRIHMTVAREHPLRFAAANTIPIAATTLGMGASSLTMADYHDMLQKAPGHMKGKLLIPVPDPSGKPKLWDWTQMLPMADWLTRKQMFGKDVPLPLPQGMVINGPGWALLDAVQNINSQTGQPIVNYAKGEGTSKWLEWALKSFGPTGPVDLAYRLKAGLQGTQRTKAEQEPQSLVRAPFQSLAPQLGNYRFLEDINKEAQKAKKGEIGASKAGFKSIGGDKRLTDEEKDAQKTKIRQNLQDVKEGFR